MLVQNTDTHILKLELLPEDEHFWAIHQLFSASSSFQSLVVEILLTPTIGSDKKENQVLFKKCYIIMIPS